MVIDSLAPLLKVADVGRSIAFYTELLPFRVVQETEAEGNVLWALLRHGAVTLMVSRSDRAGGDGIGICLYVDSARDCRAALRAKGAVTTDIRLANGMEEVRLRDPDGYELVLASPAMRIA